VRRREYVLIRDYDKLPAGAHVTPIRKEYVPKEVREALDPYNWLNEGENTFAYTQIGITILPLNVIREI
jgi:hypothetical protein